MNEIKRNFAWCDDYSEDSFVGILHENQEWSDEEYFKLENYLYETCLKLPSDFVPREIIWPAMRIYSYLSSTLCSHLDSNDGFKIKGLELVNFYDRRERLQLVFEGFFKGEMPNKNYLEY
ncbi:Imm41 family immunity protein [Shewanella insulae]|uniref:Imm41 family immunity protein n=1 Tax=Shewanella insulae TaxID=2681496 RepID=UPI003CE52A65